jgi:hypothetical protein
MVAAFSLWIVLFRDGIFSSPEMKQL